MEEDKSSTVVATATATITADDDTKPPLPEKQRKRGAFIIRAVVIFMLRHRRKAKPAQMEVARPLQQNVPPTHPAVALPPTATIASTSPPPGLRLSHGVSSCSNGGLRGYVSENNLQGFEKRPRSDPRCASAVNLRELGLEGDSDYDSDKENYDQNAGDEMIDVKAEEFIAQFYQQIKLQQMQRYNKRGRKTLESA
ncbi:hypothetical protein NMG60_11013774 [Bertholletia excelsa]